MGDKNFCMHGCYPVDNRYYYEKGLELGSIKDVLGGESDKLMEAIKEEGIEIISDIADFTKVVRIVRNNSQDMELRKEIGEKIIRAMRNELSYKNDWGEPYVDREKRKIAIGASSQGFSMDAYLFLIDILPYRYDYENVNKVKEYINISPQSQFYQEMNEKRRRAQESVNKILSSLSDLYQQKHLLEHDVRKLRERVKSFEKEKEGRDEALKADFVDLVDQHNGKNSILQMQANNIFPTITADFYRMESDEDLKDDDKLGKVPESEKAMLRKKWELYERWKEEFGKNVRNKLEDLKIRLNSVKNSIEEAEEGLRPHVRNLKKIQGTEQQELDRLADPYLVEGYSTSWRNIKLVCDKNVRGGKYKDVLIADIDHLTVAGTEQPQAPGAGGEAVLFKFDEYLVCEHVFKETFQPQVDLMENEVKEFIKRYKGVEVSDEIKESLEGIKGPNKWKNKLLGLFGEVDDYYVKNPAKLRAEDIGPPHTQGLYLDIKYGCGLFVMD